MPQATAKFAYRGNDYTFVSRDDDPLLKHHSSKKAFYELPALERLARIVGRLAPGQTDWIVDAGANIGNHSVFFADYFGVGRVYSFEMNPETFSLLEQNIEANGCTGSVVPANVGLSDHAGSAGISAPLGNPLGGAYLNFESGETSVRVERIDSLISAEDIGGRCLLLKIDVEGHELEVLRGAHGLLTGPSSPMIYAEIKEVVEWQQINEYLRGLGYAVVYAEDDPIPNFLFAPRATLAATFEPLELEDFRSELCGRVVDAWQLHRKIKSLQSLALPTIP